jgi:hypothetical protein
VPFLEQCLKVIGFFYPEADKTHRGIASVFEGVTLRERLIPMKSGGKGDDGRNGIAAPTPRAIQLHILPGVLDEGTKQEHQAIHCLKGRGCNSIAPVAWACTISPFIIMRIKHSQRGL